MVRSPLRLLLSSLCVLAATAPGASATTLVPQTVLGSDRAVARTCHDRLLAEGAAGVVQRRVTAQHSGLIQARLAGHGGSDWDVAVFGAAGGRHVAGSAHFGSTELAEGVVAAGEPLVVQACRRSGASAAVALTVQNLPVPAAAPEGVKLARVRVPAQADEDLLLSLELDLTEHGRPGYLDVLLHDAADVAALERSGLSYDVLLDDVAAADRAALAAAPAPPDGTMPSGRTNYRRLPEFGEDMKRLVAENPGLVRPLTLDLPSLEGRPVEGIEIAADVHARDGRPVFVQLGVHHAREWPSAEMPLEFAFELVNKFKAEDERARGLLGRTRVIVVPIVNPDGFNLSREAMIDTQASLLDLDFAYKRRNCRVTDFAIPGPGECALPENRRRGVDPNRNYGGFWGGPGASSSGTSDTYRGPAPFSEPETQNVKRLVSSRQVTTMITNHTYSDLVLRPPGLSSAPPPVDEGLYKELGDAMAAENGYTSQPSYELYDTTGTTEDWSYYATGGLGYTFEIGLADAATGMAVTGSGFHPPYPIGVMAEWFGKYPTGGGNREAYYVALESTADAARHAVISGRGAPGNVIRVHKEFETRMKGTGRSEDDGAEVPTVRDVLDSTMVVPASGAFEFHVNPSTRPLVAPEGKVEAWTVTCETADGRVLTRRDITVGRGERVEVGELCAEAPAPVSSSVGAFTVSAKYGRASLRTLARKGLPVKVTCSGACRLSVALVADRRTARRLRLGRKAVTLGRVARKRVARTVSLRVKPSRRAARPLARSRKVALTLRVRGTSAAGAKAGLAKRLTFRR